jgi:hypothetical protein
MVPLEPAGLSRLLDRNQLSGAEIVCHAIEQTGNLVHIARDFLVFRGVG